MQIKKYQNSPGPLQRDTITIGELPEEYLSKYGNRIVVFPSGKQMTLREARKEYGPTHIKTSNLPGYDELQLPYQEQNDINDARQMQIRQGDRSVRDRSMTQMNKTEMNNLANLSLTIGGTAAAIPVLLTAPIATVGAFAGGVGGNFLGDKATQRFSDGKYNTWGDAMQDWTNGYIRADNAAITNPGALLGGAIGGAVVPTALVKGAQAIASSRPVVTRRLASAINQAVKSTETPRELFPGQIGWAPRQTLTGYHASETPILEFDYNFPNWAVKTHNAPKGIYFTANETAPSGGFLAKRPYVQQVKTTLDRPMVQVGEVPAVGKNAIRNQIEQIAMDRGVDGIIYDGIADNQLKGQTIVKTLNPDVNVNVMTRKKLENDIASSPTEQYYVDDWLQLVDSSSGVEDVPDTSWLVEELTKAHKKIRDYYNSNEFKNRVMATGEFTEEEYHKLIDEINKLIANHKGVKLIPRPLGERANASNLTNRYTGFTEQEYYTDVPQSKEQLISNIYHEFGGHLFSNGAFNLENLQIDYPMITKLNNYNKTLFQTTPIENFDALYSSEPKIRNLMIRLNPNESTSQIDKWVTKEINSQNWYKNKILEQPHEIRARLFTWLNKLKRLGYDTEHATPEELIKWTNQAYRNGENMPYDINHIIAVFGNNKDLLSKFLISTGVISTAAASSN